MLIIALTPLYLLGTLRPTLLTVLALLQGWLLAMSTPRQKMTHRCPPGSHPPRALSIPDTAETNNFSISPQGNEFSIFTLIFSRATVYHFQALPASLCAPTAHARVPDASR